MKTMLQTARLVLRELGPNDLDFVAALLAHAEVMRFWPKCYSRPEAEEWIARQQARYASHGYGYWLALDRSTGMPVGQAGLLPQQVDGREKSGLGYIIHRPFWRRGYATEAAAGCLAFAFGMAGPERVLALVRPENTPSQGVARKLGMSVEGQTLYADHEHLIFAITRAEWERRQGNTDLDQGRNNRGYS